MSWNKWEWSTKINSEGSENLDGEEGEVINSLFGHSSSTSTTQPPSKNFHSQLIPSTSRNFYPVLSSFPPPSPKSSSARPLLASTMKPSPIQQPRKSQVLTSQELKPVSRTRRSREDWSLFLFPAAQVFQNREHWPIRVTREDPTVMNEGQDSVTRLFRRVNRNRMEVIVYANARMIPGTTS
ncbi:hypothetical protein O181_008271 [Austropuccinia psidii MF-1]|uniref:Uncharacterized protein n=1 Tax=Austropuccinia psidii MF-1 TaxID=1389203 RepID=A0A9Q3BMA5_9BASI|nr:hypothetical protein [Austropuccinia psidii MF-1]